MKLTSFSFLLGGYSPEMHFPVYRDRRFGVRVAGVLLACFCQECLTVLQGK